MVECGRVIGLGACFLKKWYNRRKFRVKKENTWTGNTGGSHDYQFNETE
jgi:hypothetical protein